MHHDRRFPRASLLVPLACLLALPPSAAAANDVAGALPPVAGLLPDTQDTLAQRLDAQGVRYERDADGDYRVVFAWQQEDRSQLAFVAGTAHVLGDSAVREVFSPAAPVPQGGFSAAQADMLMRDSQRNVLGSWEIAGDTLFYVIKLHDDADGARFEQALEVAAELADDMELQLTGEDAM
ncbi:conserved exported hypothetical protein [Luteimonas sp. 9C]|uniref:hypothetical protein n=1 Tax=Luteimonas sp. 9C TaxID=2653148 RepID=UPI0012F06A27|nr:hypothetical protein [Luteimonas sp. 9C]VXB27441.1 conserved exported hypothetical protein [Luteimonas sp. 9C]